MKILFSQISGDFISRNHKYLYHFSNVLSFESQNRVEDIIICVTNEVLIAIKISNLRELDIYVKFIYLASLPKFRFVSL